MPYQTEKLNQLTEELTNLIVISSEKLHPQLIKNYMKLAFLIGKTAGMDILLRKWEENGEAVYGK